MAHTWTNDSVTKTYGRWAPVYDKVFGNIFELPRRTAIAAAEEVGGRILEVGVGTGLSLPFYSQRCRVTGIDISEEMLSVAEERVKRDGLNNVEALEVMDAQNLEFDDNSFDVVTAQYVVNTIPDPEAALDEFVRVLHPGGELIIINRIGAAAGPRRKVEKLLQPVVERLGWRSEFPWERFEQWASRSNVRLIERRPMPPFKHFALIRFGKTDAPAARVRDMKFKQA